MINPPLYNYIEAKNPISEIPSPEPLFLSVFKIKVKQIIAVFRVPHRHKPSALNEQRADRLRKYMVGWVNYFKIADMKKLMETTDEWLRRRIRMIYWKQWKKIKTRLRRLKQLGIEEEKAWQFANTRKGYWRISNSPILKRPLDNQTLRNLGYLFFSDYYRQARVN